MPRYMPDDWPLPVIDQFNRPFFTTGRLVLQECASCGAVQHPPEEICQTCYAMEFRAREVDEHGTIFSFVVARHPSGSPVLSERVPYVIALVSLDERPEIRVLGNVVDVPPDEVRIGLPVKTVFEEAEDPDGGTILLPQWAAA